MQNVLILWAACLCLAGVAFGQHADPEKAAELKAAGYETWTPGQSQGQGPVLGDLTHPITLPGGPEDTATMNYDNGVINAIPMAFGQVYGNKFNLGVGGVELDTVTLNSFSFYYADDDVTDDNMFFQPASVGAAPSQLMSRASVNVMGLVNAGPSFSNLGALNVIPQSVLGTSGVFDDTFFLGGWCVNEATTLPIDNDALGLSTGGQAKGYTAASGVGAVSFTPGAFNAVLRANVTSPNAVPVELMAFETDDDD